MTTASPAAPSVLQVPSHIPPYLVRDVDLWQEISAAGKDAYLRAAALHQETPPIFYVPRLGYLPGAWVPRRAEDLRQILQDPETFSSVGLSPFARLLGDSWKLIPLELDPPDHAKYRALLNPLFTPRLVDQQEAKIRARAAELIDGFVVRGQCDFNEDFANAFPTLIFLNMMGWPAEETPRFVKWTQTIVKATLNKAS